ncbi:MAG: Rpn family recombination-promoting nuclease/putative transposase, partial [Chloroflexi bacterium]|nr:Rpn family recombination-promoting nuclease/putative transposase [Chloroflexota bacterium]
MNELSNPHDRFFKETFSRVEVARDLLANYLPPEVVALLDLETLEARSDSFVDADLQEQFADLLYQVQMQDGRPAYVYVLLEHKSYPDPNTAFQILRYQVRIWEDDWRNGEVLRPIIPLVLYHGRERWRAATDFAGLFSGDEALRPYWPQSRYELLDLSGYSDAEIRGTTHLQISLLVMRYILDPALRDHLEDIFALFRDLAESRTALEYLRTVLYYMGQAARHLQPEEMV